MAEYEDVQTPGDYTGDYVAEHVGGLSTVGGNRGGSADGGDVVELPYPFDDPKDLAEAGFPRLQLLPRAAVETALMLVRRLCVRWACSLVHPADPPSAVAAFGYNAQVDVTDEGVVDAARADISQRRLQATFPDAEFLHQALDDRSVMRTCEPSACGLAMLARNACVP